MHSPVTYFLYVKGAIMFKLQQCLYASFSIFFLSGTLSELKRLNTI